MMGWDRSCDTVPMLRFTESTPFQPDVDITALALVGGPAPCCAKNPNGKLQNSNSDIWGQGALASAHHSNSATCQPLPIQPSFPKSRLNWPQFCHQCCFGFLLNIFGKNISVSLSQYITLFCMLMKYPSIAQGGLQEGKLTWLSICFETLGLAVNNNCLCRAA